MAYISRDPFARTELHRAREEGECAWCGQPARWRYRVESDGGATYYDDRVFCAVDCRRSFYA